MQAFAAGARSRAWRLFQERGVAFDPAAYIPAVRAYYARRKGRMQSIAVQFLDRADVDQP